MVHHVQATVAFNRDKDNVGFYQLTRIAPFSHDGTMSWVVLQPIKRGGVEEFWVVSNRDRLTRVLARPDLTLRHGQPLVIANGSKRVLGIAAGPPTAPPQVGVSAVFDLEHQTLAPVGDDQPEWWLFDGEPDDPFTYTGASAMVANWKADHEARQAEAN